MDPKSMPNPTKGGQGPPPRSARGGLWLVLVRFENLPRPEKGGPKNEPKKGPSQKSAFGGLRDEIPEGAAECADPIWLLNRDGRASVGSISKMLLFLLFCPRVYWNVIFQILLKSFCFIDARVSAWFQPAAKHSNKKFPNYCCTDCCMKSGKFKKYINP